VSQVTDPSVDGHVVLGSLGCHDVNVLASILKVFASPARLQMLAAMSGRHGEDRLIAKDFEPITGLSQPCIASHTRVLVASGLVTVTKHRGYSYYEIEARRVTSVAEAIRSLLPSTPSRR
jgi:DNA-binding transcriptional ArsR family regulator